MPPYKLEVTLEEEEEDEDEIRIRAWCLCVWTAMQTHCHHNCTRQLFQLSRHSSSNSYKLHFFLNNNISECVNNNNNCFI